MKVFTLSCTIVICCGLAVASPLKDSKISTLNEDTQVALLEHESDSKDVDRAKKSLQLLCVQAGSGGCGGVHNYGGLGSMGGGGGGGGGMGGGCMQEVAVETGPFFPIELGGGPSYPSYPAQGYPTQGYPTQGYPTQGYPTQGYPTQGYPVASYPIAGPPAPTIQYGPPPAPAQPAPSYPIFPAPAPAPAPTPVQIFQTPAPAPAPGPSFSIVQSPAAPAPPMQIFQSPAPAPAPAPSFQIVQPAPAPAPAPSSVQIVQTPAPAPAPGPSFSIVQPAPAPAPAQVPVQIYQAPPPAPAPAPQYQLLQPAPAPAPAPQYYPQPAPASGASYAPSYYPSQPIPMPAPVYPSYPLPMPMPMPSGQGSGHTLTISDNFHDDHVCTCNSVQHQPRYVPSPPRVGMYPSRCQRGAETGTNAETTQEKVEKSGAEAKSRVVRLAEAAPQQQMQQQQQPQPVYAQRTPSQFYGYQPQVSSNLMSSYPQAYAYGTSQNIKRETEQQPTAVVADSKILNKRSEQSVAGLSEAAELAPHFDNTKDLTPKVALIKKRMTDSAKPEDAKAEEELNGAEKSSA